MPQQVETTTRIETISEKPPYQQVYQQLIQEGLEMFATMQQQPVLSGETIAQWSAYYYTVTDLYGQLVAGTGDNPTIAIPSSPVIETFKASSPHLFNLLVEEATQLPRPADGLQEALLQDPSGIPWLQQRSTDIEGLDTESPGVMLALMRAQTLFDTHQKD